MEVRVIFYDYVAWVVWPENDIREYALEIAEHYTLTADQAEYLKRQMIWRAGHYPERLDIIGPKKMSERTEALERLLGKDEVVIFKQNRRLNKPQKPIRYNSEYRYSAVGAGITQKWMREVVTEDPTSAKERKRSAKMVEKRPFTTTISKIQGLADDAKWEANCYPIDYGNWLVSPEVMAPHEGLFWYSEELTKTYHEARQKAAARDHEAALAKAFEAGQIFAELSIRLGHAALYDQYQSLSQKHANRKDSRKVSDEVLAKAYQEVRPTQKNKTAAKRLVAEKYRISESTVTNALERTGTPQG